MMTLSSRTRLVEQRTGMGLSLSMYALPAVLYDETNGILGYAAFGLSQEIYGMYRLAYWDSVLTQFRASMSDNLQYLLLV